MSEQNPVPAIAESKSIFTSNTFWGVVVSLVASGLNKWGYTLTDTMQGEVVNIILTVIAALGGLWAIIGRVRAKQPAAVISGQEKLVEIKRVAPFLLIPLLLLAGCVSNPYQKRAKNDTPLTNDVRTMYAGIVNQLTILRKAGYFNDQEWKVEIKDLRTQAGTVIESMEAAELLSQQSVIDAKSLDLRRVLDKLIEWRLKGNTRKTLNRREPTTRSSTTRLAA